MLFAVLLWKCGEVVVCSACQATFFVMVLHGVRYVVHSVAIVLHYENSRVLRFTLWVLSPL